MTVEALAQRDLFGGAITLACPRRLIDVSDFRPVPDNQEVFADGSSDQSLVVEIVVSFWDHLVQGDPDLLTAAESQTPENAIPLQEHTQQLEKASAAEFYFRDLAEDTGAQNVQLQNVAELSKSC